MKPSARVSPKRLAVLAVLALGLAGADEGREEKRPRFKAAATVEPAGVIEVGAQVSGKIIAFGADPDGDGGTVGHGSRVRAGTVLLRLDPTPYKAEVAVARAGVAMAEADVERARAELALAVLREKRSKDRETDALLVKVAEANLARARAALDRARAVLDRATFQLECCTIKSPVDSVVIDRRVNLGQTARPGTSLFVLAGDLRRVQVWARVPEDRIRHVAAGQKVSFTVDAYPRLVFAGTVAQRRLNPETGKGKPRYTVVIDARNDDRKLVPSLTAEVDFGPAP